MKTDEESKEKVERGRSKFVDDDLTRERHPSVSKVTEYDLKGDLLGGSLSGYQ